MGDLNLGTTSSGVHFTGGTTFSGANATFANNAYLYWQQVGTLAGKAITQGTNSYIYVSGVNNTLTLDAATTVTGDVSIYSDGNVGTAITNQGAITHTNGTGQIYAANFTNNGSITATAGTLYLNYPSVSYNATNTGTITADGSGTTIYLRGDFDNNGTMTAQNAGHLLWDGTNTTANLGNVVLNGGRALLNGTIDNTAAILTAPGGGAFELYGGTIQGGTIAAGALTFTTSGGYLDGASLTGDFNLAVSSSGVRFLNGATFTGANASLASNAYLYWQQVGTLAGKAITQGTNSYIYVNGVNSALTLDAATTVTGDVSIYSDGSAGTAITNQGAITHSTGTGQIYAANFTNTGSITATAGTLYLNYPSASYNATNTGTVTADGSGATIYLRGNFDNNGTMTAQNAGILRWDGTYTTANLGNVVINGGRALLDGLLINSAAVLAAPTGGTFELLGGTIQGGTIAAGALTFTTSGGYLDGASLTGDLNLGTASSGVRFIGGANFTGANAALANNTYLYWQQVGALAGKAITQGTNSSIHVSGANNALTLDAATTVTGDISIYSDGSAGTAITNQGAITHSNGTGQIYATNFTNAGSITATAGTLYLNYPSATYNATNTGTVTADGSGTTIYLRGNFDNNGTMTAQNAGSLRWDGTYTTANLGNVVVNGGRALLDGLLINSATVLAAPTGGAFELLGGTIQGGTIAAGALTFTTSSGYLDGVSLTGDLNLGTASSGVRFLNGTAFTGANATFANNAYLYWQQAGTLAGKSIIQGTNAYIYVSGANNTLTLDATTTVSGDVSIYSDSSVGTAITNQGAITHTGGTGSLYARSFTNAGTISATGGFLNIGTTSSGYTAVNSIAGTIHVNGGNVSLHAPAAAQFMNLGTINVQSGTLISGAYLTNGSTGLIWGAGTISGDLTLAGGTLAPGNSIGTLTLLNSDFLATSASIIELELGGVTSDRITFQNPTSAVNLGAGLLALDLMLLAPPTEGTNYTIMNISSGGSGFAGYFAGLPNSGDALTANYAGTDYTLNIGYLPNSIVLSYAVPEPSTYALMAAGLGLLFLRRFRRRAR
ncbi:MAG: PEP-CTERM sorting domain-containing protein [Opitutaceae bacterium]|nr:PEP-CTERM sorting domain-containing protein [Opitutaceae bacterium]